ncbi:hypothetical protein BO85DRAFT_455624 [Aspergillus piperis CBS 112811]|uniref:Bromodomain associated domain-containing protein n=1 Tax=Aspergillus piperis CBS 112811 TaxID=1448313 RepID=A0A8G1RD50_9EURO|nr:hypothetical protein BO85DRAFT_455624 [Aspergillus piperis CBS 112811]RAH63663.1 hypothetical protein BO85DRAFT_455624 [Aspergillus piperis CBS 112811]
MVSSEPTVKRSSSSLPEGPDAPDVKRTKRPYHHHHRLQSPVAPALPEPAIVDEACIDHVLNRSIGQYLQECGFDIADPAALDAFRRVTEEYLLRFASYVRQAMLSSRRIQPIPQDFEYALKRQSVPVSDLLPHVKRQPNIEPIPTLLPSPPPEEDSFKTLPSLGPQLSGEDDRAHNAHIPKHFPDFPSKHTYRHTPVFTEREQDPRVIRERATEDGRHGEEALRKLARAAFKDNNSGSSVRDKKQWGRRAESMDGMFEKTVRALAKKIQKPGTGPDSAGPMEIDSGAGADKASRSKLALNIELPPIINCERDLWRRAPTSGSRRTEENKLSSAKDTPDMSRVDSWAVELLSAARLRSASSFAIRIGSQAVVSTRKGNSPAKQPHNRLTIHHTRLRNPFLGRIARVLDHLQQFAFLQLDRAAFATLLLEVLGDDVDVVWKALGGENGDKRSHGDKLLHDLRNLSHGIGDSDALSPRLGVQVLDDLLGVFTTPAPAAQNIHLGGGLQHGHSGDAQGADFYGTEAELPAQSELISDEHVRMHSLPMLNINRTEPVLEISSKLSAAGKSHLLYYLAAVAILPSVFKGVPLGGHGSAVIFIDTDGRFDAERLISVVRGIVKARIDALAQELFEMSSESDNEDIETMLVASLQHVHVFRPQSSAALLATLQNLDAYIPDLSRHLSSTRPVHTIYLDSANAFFWQDRLQDEIARVEDIGRVDTDSEHERSRKRRFQISDLYAAFVAELKRLQRLLGCMVVYTTTVQGRFHGAHGGNSAYTPSGPYDLYNPRPSVPKAPSFGSDLPAPWGRFPTLRVVVQRDSVRPFPPTMTAQNAQRGAPRRQEVVNRGRFSAWVNEWRRDEWPRRVLEGLKQNNGGKFAFRIGRDGVDIG